jgi:hypothetical protein
VTKLLAEAERHFRDRTPLWAAFDAACRGARAEGRRRWSARAAWNAMRWGGWKGRLDNDLTSGLARVWMRENGAWGFFETRAAAGSGEPDGRQPSLF